MTQKNWSTGEGPGTLERVKVVQSVLRFDLIDTSAIQGPGPTQTTMCSLHLPSLSTGFPKGVTATNSKVAQDVGNVTKIFPPDAS